MNFITLHIVTGKATLVNVEKIISVSPEDRGTVLLLHGAGKYRLHAVESLATVAAMLGATITGWDMATAADRYIDEETVTSAI